MPSITFISFTGDCHTIDADTGVSLMQNALNGMVPGIDGDCGGSAACGTCHCFVDPRWHAQTGEPDPTEESMLGMRPDREAESRLGCQIEVTDDLDGLVVRLPQFQM